MIKSSLIIVGIKLLILNYNTSSRHFKLPLKNNLTFTNLSDIWDTANEWAKLSQLVQARFKLNDQHSDYHLISIL